MQVILVTVDSLRADHLSAYGYDRETMPALDRLVEDGTVFENAFANGPYTRVSIPSFMTSQHLAYRDVEAFPTIPSVLSDQGMRTAVIGTQTGIGLVDGEFRFDETIDLGRDEYHEASRAQQSVRERITQRINQPATKVSRWLQSKGADRVYNALKTPYNAVFSNTGFRFLGYTSAEVVTDRAIEWLTEHGDEDFFLWLHYMEAHRPYGVHDDDPAYLESTMPTDELRPLLERAGLDPASLSEVERQQLVDLYDSDLRYCSRHLDRLFDELERQGLWEDCAIAFSSDHGEEFREHGHFFHRNYPYDELIHVPLLVRDPTHDSADRVTETRELLDLAPTIVDLAGGDPSAQPFEGQPLFEGDARRVVSLGQPQGEKPAVAVRTDDWKLVFDEERTWLFDLDTDPGETRDVADAHAETVRELRESVPEFLLERNVEAPREPEDAVDREQLDALGYMELRD